MKCIKNIKTGEVAKLSDTEAYAKVRSKEWNFICHQAYRDATKEK